MATTVAGQLLSAGLPAANTAAFPEFVRAVAAQLTDPVAEFLVVLRSPNESMNVRFAALYGVLHRYRREGKFDAYRDLALRYEVDFGNQPYYETFRVIWLTSGSASRQAYDEALLSSSRAVELLADNAGVLHQNAELVATYAEIYELRDSASIRAALANVNEALRLSAASNPQYYATRARLQLINNNPATARSDISIAIAQENALDPDFARRVSRYESIRSLILIFERQQRFLALEGRLRNELEGLRSQQLQLLGLLAAVIAFISSAATLAARADLPTGFRLFVVAGGVISLVFTAISTQFGQISIVRLIPGIMIGVGLIAFGYFVPVPV